MNAAAPAATVQDLLRKGVEYLGPEGIGWVFIVALVASIFLTYRVTRGLIRLLRDPTVGKRRPQRVKPKLKTDAPQQEAREADEEPQEQEAQEPQNDEHLPPREALATQPAVRNRTRIFHTARHAASLKGIKRIGVLAVSPCQRYALVSCRVTGKVMMIPRLMETPTETFAAALRTGLLSFIAVPDLEDRAVVTSVGFDPSGHYFVLGDSTHDTFLCYSTNGVDTPYCQWTLKLPKGQVVADKGKVSVLRNAEQIAFLNSADCSIEIMSSSGATIGKDRFKVGRAAALAFVDPLIVGAGNYMPELRVSEVVVRDSVTLEKRAIVAGKPHVAFMQILVPGSPKMNTRHLLVAAFATGCVEVYNLDVRWKDGEDLKPIGGFDDAEYSSGMDGMAVSVIGDSYHEALVVCLWHRTDFSLFIQNKVDAMARSATDPATQPMQMRHAVDVHDAHDGGSILFAQFVCDGRGILTADEDSARPVRLWDLNCL